MANNNTIFDDVFRTMLEKMPELIIPLINEIFSTDYPMDTPIIQLRNEHQTKNGERITDSYFIIGEKRYHIECQSTKDSGMIIRMIEYDFSISLENIKRENDIYRMYFPHSCILYLRGKHADSQTIEIVMPDGTIAAYQVPVLCVEKYSCTEMFQKKLMFLLPFYIMRYEKKRPDSSQNPEVLEQLLSEYASIMNFLNQEFMVQGRERTYRDLIALIERISDYIFADNETVKERLGDFMRGKLLELPSEKLIKQGMEQGSIQVAKKMLKDSRFSLEDISNFSGLSAEEILKLKENQE